MRIVPLLATAALLAALASPALAQTDPHHPEGTDAPTAETPADPAGATAMDVTCPDSMEMMTGMMGGMQPDAGGSPRMRMMQMMQMMQMQMMQQMMQQEQMPGPKAPTE